MNEHLSILLYAITAVVVVVNPPSALLTFASMIGNMDEKTKNAYAGKSIVLGCFVAVFFAVTGDVVLQLMNISVDSLRVAGGVLLFMIGYNMTTAKTNTTLTKAEIDNTQDKDFWIFPIAIPLLCGPGLISTVIGLMRSSPGLVDKAVVIVSIVLVFALTYVGFYFSEKINDLLGYTGHIVITRILGLFLAAISVGMIAAGIYGIWVSYMG